MTQPDRIHGAGRRDEPVRGNEHDMQIDRETGRPVTIVPDGEKERNSEAVDDAERLNIDPNSRVPRPVQPDLA